MGILAETNRGKDLILREIKQRRLKIPLKSMLNSFEILESCPEDFVSNLHRALMGDNVQGFEEVRSLTKTYHWLFTDIVGGANPTIPTKEQVRKIIVLNELMARTETFRNRDPASTVILPVGDGVAIGFGDSIEKPLQLAVELHKALFRYNESKDDKEKLIIRIGIDMGSVYFVKDLNGKDNVWGPGIILTRRVMDLCGEMNIFASARMAEEMKKLSPEYKEILHHIGNYSIKHDEELSVYNIYGNGFGNKTAPRKKKVVASNLQRDIKTENNFSFNEVQINLEVLEPKTMLVRHRWIWDVVNVSKGPMDHIFYRIDGDIPKEFGDMNVSIRDDRGNPLEVRGINVNKPYHKEFSVQLSRLVKPKQRKTVTLEYNWEEPERVFFYRVASGCRQFTYSLTAPKETQLKIKIFKVDSETGSKIDATPEPVIKNLNGKTIVTWTKNELEPEEAYQINW